MVAGYMRRTGFKGMKVLVSMLLFMCMSGQAMSEDTAAAPEEKPAAAGATAPAGTAITSKTMFYRLLARKPAATVEDAIRALARHKGGLQELRPLADEIAFLEKNGMHFPEGMVKRKDVTMTMGSAAHMLMKVMGIKGKSFMYKMRPSNQRYAMREAQDLGIIPGGSFVGQTLSGNELLGLLVRVTEISEAQKSDTTVKK